MQTLITKHAVCPDTLSDEQVRDFQTNGYLAFTDVLSPQEVADSKAGLSELIAANYRARQAADFDQALYHRENKLYIQFEPGAEITDEADNELQVRKLMWFGSALPFFRNMIDTQPKIQGVVSSLLGQNPICFQDMALIKPPFVGSEKPWHQDNAYFSVTPLDAIVGVWIALDDATVENGCMHVLAGGHKMGPKRHYHGMDCEIVADRLDPSQAVPVEVPAGGAMFFYGMLPHQTPPNASPLRRRALQFHYRSAQSQVISKTDYDTIFAEADGTPASCAAAPPK